jgi:hypothetical protein
VLSSWLPWIVLAAVLITVPVALRLFAGDDGPDNAITQEQPGENSEEDREPAAEALPPLAVRLAA